MPQYLRTTTIPHEVRRHPGWRISEGDQPGRLLTDDELAEHGWLPIVDEPPAYDPETEYLVRKPEWEIVGEGAEARAHVGYDIVAYTEQELAERARADVPYSITRRQVILGLVAAEIITPEEGKAAATTGAVPTTVQAVFDNLPADEKLAAEITWATMSVAERDHPLVAALAAANGMDEAAIDDFFRMAGAL